MNKMVDVFTRVVRQAGPITLSETDLCAPLEGRLVFEGTPNGGLIIQFKEGKENE